VKIGNRIAATSLRHPVSMNRKIDLYLSENLGDLIDEYKVANRTDLLSVETKFNDQEKKMEDLEDWREKFSDRILKTETRIVRMKKKYGVE
jgi:5-enolpyruvylshikimate-3-phosphate synthase